MKICIASSGLGHIARGIEAWAEDLAIALANRGKDVTLYKGSGKSNTNFEQVIPCWTRNSIKTRWLVRSVPNAIGWRLGIGSRYAVEQRTFARSLVNTLKSDPMDVLHVQDPFVALQVQKAQQRGQIHTRVILAHGTEEPLGFQQRVTYLQHLAPWHRHAARQAGVDREDWTTIPNFIDVKKFRPGDPSAIRDELGIPQQGLMVLVAAAIKRKHKRIDYLLREFRDLRDQQPNLPVWFVVAGGRETDTESLIAMGNELLGDRIRFLVQFPRSRMSQLYRAADLFTLGSLKEMMPIALLEATASGLPCLVNQHPVMQWMVGPGGDSLDLTIRGNWKDAAAQLLTEPTRRQQFAVAARQHCVENFSTDVVVDQILDYYRRVTGTRSAAA